MSSASFVRDWVNISLEERETLFPSSWNQNSDLKQQRHTHTVVHVCWSISQKATFHVEAGKIRKRKKGPPFIQGPSAWPLTRFFSEKHPNANASAASFWFNYFSPSAKMWWDKFVFKLLLVYTTFAAFVLTLKAKELTSFFLRDTIRGQHSIFCVCQFFLRYPKQKWKLIAQQAKHLYPDGSFSREFSSRFVKKKQFFYFFGKF